MPCRVNAYNLKVVWYVGCWEIGAGRQHQMCWIKMTKVWEFGTGLRIDLAVLKKVSIRSINKMQPQKETLSTAYWTSQAFVPWQGLCRAQDKWCFGYHFLQTHLTLINECIVVALSCGRVAAMHHSSSILDTGWK